jgi:hypothetical protein
MKAKRRKPVEKTSERMDIRTIARAANVSIATVSPHHEQGYGGQS